MKTSVVVTAYNQEKFIEETIASVARQTRVPHELIVVNDKSTDRSAELIDKAVKGLPFPVIVQHQEENQGVSAARNWGIDRATGDIVALLDGDDTYYPTKIEKSVNVLEKYPAVGLVYSDYDMYDQATGSLKREFKHPYVHGILRQTCIVSTNSIGRKNIFAAAGPFKKHLEPCEDYDMWLRISDLAMIHHIPDNLFMYRVHGGSATVAGREKALRQLAVLRKEWGLA